MVVAEEAVDDLGVAEAILATTNPDQMVEHPLFEAEDALEGVADGDSHSLLRLMYHHLVWNLHHHRHPTENAELLRLRGVMYVGLTAIPWKSSRNT